MKNMIIALSFLTIIPFPGVLFNKNGKELSASASWFTVAGAVIGLTVAGSAYLLSALFHPGPVIVTSIMINFLLTRGLHLDGLADAADGLIGTTDRDRAFKAMDDSAVGVMGGTAIFLFVLLRYTLLVSCSEDIFLMLLLLTPVIGRWSIVNIGTWFEPARNKGLGDLFLSALGLSHLLKTTLLPVIFLVAIIVFYPGVTWSYALGWILAAAGSILFALYAVRRLGGISGDILGACNEMAELLFLAVFIAVNNLL